MKHAVVPLFL